jgi:hypothetical protein
VSAAAPRGHRRRSGGFRAFRRSRPFWAGVFTILGGLEILALPLSPVASLVLLGVAGVSSIVMGLLLVVMGLFMWFSPVNRVLAGVLTIVFALTSFVTSNLGGLVVGMVLGIIGGALCLAWTDGSAPPPPSRRRRAGRRARPTPPPAEPPTGPLTAPVSRRPGRRLGLVALVVTAVVAGPGAGAAVAAPSQCLLGILLCPPEPTTTSPAPPTATPGPAPPPRAPASTTPPPGTAPPADPAAGLLPGPLDGVLPDGVAPDGVLPDGLLAGGLVPEGLLPPAGLLPDGLLIPVLPTVAPEPGLVVSGLVGTLTMDALTVTNFRFLGVVEHRTPTGTIRALRIVVDSTDITQLGVVMPGPEATLLVDQRPGAPNASSPELVLDVTRLSLRILGVLPVEFSFAFPPPPLLTIPVLSGTDVDIDVVHVGSDLIGPGLDVTTGPPSAGVGARTGSPPTVASLVSLASVLDLPALLEPYGFTGDQAAAAVEEGAATPAPPPREVAERPDAPADDVRPLVGGVLDSLLGD